MERVSAQIAAREVRRAAMFADRDHRYFETHRFARAAPVMAEKSSMPLTIGIFIDILPRLRSTTDPALRRRGSRARRDR